MSAGDGTASSGAGAIRTSPGMSATASGIAPDAIASPQAASSAATPAVEPRSASATLVTPSAASRAAARASAACPSAAVGAGIAEATRSHASGPRRMPGRLAGLVALDRAPAGDVGGGAVEPGQGEGKAVRRDGMPRDVGQEDRSVGHGPVQVVAGRVVRTVPAGRVVAGDQPGVGLQALCAARQGLEGSPALAAGEEPHPGDEALPVRVRVRLHEARQHGSAAEVDDVRVGPGQGQDLGVVAHGQDPVVRVADRGRTPPGRIGNAWVAAGARGGVRRPGPVEREDRPAVEHGVVVGHRAPSLPGLRT